MDYSLHAEIPVLLGIYIMNSVDYKRCLPSGPQLLHSLLLAAWAVKAQTEKNALTCKPLVGLPLAPPYPPAYLQLTKLPVCSQYKCSCCNQTHALGIYRALWAAREDPSFSRACLFWTTRMACRVCDPEVGVGLKPAVCRHTCDEWLAACANEYFAFDTAAAAAASTFGPQLIPCAAAAGSGSAAALLSPLICSRLGDTVRDGEELCREAGYELVTQAVGSAGSGQQESCFDGSPDTRSDFCERPQPSASSRGRGEAEQEPLSPAVYFVMLAVISSLAWLGYTSFTSIAAREDEQMRQLHWQQLQGRDR